MSFKTFIIIPISFSVMILNGSDQAKSSIVTGLAAKVAHINSDREAFVKKYDSGHYMRQIGKDDIAKHRDFIANGYNQALLEIQAKGNEYPVHALDTGNVVLQSYNDAMNKMWDAINAARTNVDFTKNQIEKIISEYDNNLPKFVSGVDALVENSRIDREGIKEVYFDLKDNIHLSKQDKLNTWQWARNKVNWHYINLLDKNKNITNMKIYPLTAIEKKRAECTEKLLAEMSALMRMNSQLFTRVVVKA